MEMKVSQLKKQAASAGVAADAIAEADDAPSPKDWLIALIVGAK